MEKSAVHGVVHALQLTSRRSQPPLVIAVPLSRLTPLVGGGSAFFVRWLMRAFIFILSLFGAFIPIEAFAQTNDLYLTFTHQSRHQEFEWHLSFSRILATPEWNMESGKIPLAPDKALQIAKDWFKPYGSKNPVFISFEVRPFIMKQVPTERLDASYCKRFYYSFHFVPALLDTMDVYVLMDGTVVEPTKRPQQGEWYY